VGNASDKEQPSQNTFHIAVDLKGLLPAAPSQGSSHFEWSIITDPIDVNGPEDADDKVGLGQAQSQNLVMRKGMHRVPLNLQHQ